MNAEEKGNFQTGFAFYSCESMCVWCEKTR